MFICTFINTLLFLAKLNYIIKFEALYNAAVLFKQFLNAFLIQV